MVDRYFDFNSEEEGKAFISGVEYVNDSDITVEGLFWIPGPKSRGQLGSTYFVHVTDASKCPSKDEPNDSKPKRWKKRVEVKD